ncbi:MAG: hypothetical protein AB7V22_03285 [Kiritimatiellia bacterium]
MPISYQADPGKRRIVAEASGAIGQQDLFAYQKDVGTRPEWAGLDEIFDVSHVDSLLDIHIDNLKALAQYAAGMDRPEQPTKFAIVAPQDLYFGLGRMYESLRESVPHATRQVAAFRTRAEAERWLDEPADEPAAAEIT